MAKVLLIDDRKNFQLVYSVNFKVYLDADVDVATKLEEGLDLLKSKTQYSLIVCKAQIAAEKTASKLCAYLKNIKADIPLIVLGKDEEAVNLAVILETIPELSDLLKVMARGLGVTAKDMAQKKVGEFYPILSQHLLSMNVSCCDLYFQTEDKNYNCIYEKLFSEGEKISEHQAETFIRRSKYIYLRSQERLKFANSFTATLTAKMADPNTADSEKMDLLNSTFDFIGDRLQETEISPETIQVVKVAANAMQEVVDNNSTIQKLLKQLLANTSSYRYRHSQFLTLICSLIIDKMEWGTKEQKETLSFVAFFHDLPLKTDTQARVRSDKELLALNLSEEDNKIITHHAFNAAEMVRKMPRAPMGADKILEQHHGAKSGIGFPATPFNNMTPLARVFLVAEEFTDYFLETIEAMEPFNRKRALAMIKKKYPRGAFQRVREAIEEIKI